HQYRTCGLLMKGTAACRLRRMPPHLKDGASCAFPCELSRSIARQPLLPLALRQQAHSALHRRDLSLRGDGQPGGEGVRTLVDGQQHAEAPEERTLTPEFVPPCSWMMQPSTLRFTP